jgi:hypothetical protein
LKAFYSPISACKLGQWPSCGFVSSLALNFQLPPPPLVVGGSALNTVDYAKLVFSLLSRLHVFLRCVYASSCMSMDGMVAWLRITKSLSRDFYLDLACISYSDIGFRLGRGCTIVPVPMQIPCCLQISKVDSRSPLYRHPFHLKKLLYVL